MKKFRYILILPILFISTMAMAQVTIGSSVIPNPGAILDLKQDNNKEENSTLGLGLPRVELDNINELYPMFAMADPAYTNDEKKKHTGLTIYNITNDLAIQLCPGPFAWNGSKWIRLWGECESNSISCNSSSLLQITTVLGNPITPVSHNIDLTLVYDGINLPTGTILNQAGTAINGLLVTTTAAVIGTAPLTPTVNVSINGTPTFEDIVRIPIEIILNNGEKLTCGINVEIIAN